VYEVTWGGWQGEQLRELALTERMGQSLLLSSTFHVCFHISQDGSRKEPSRPSPPTPLIKLSNIYYQRLKSLCEMSWWIN